MADPIYGNAYTLNNFNVATGSYNTLESAFMTPPITINDLNDDGQFTTEESATGPSGMDLMYTGWSLNGDPIFQDTSSSAYYLFTNATIRGSYAGPTTVNNALVYCFTKGTQISTPSGTTSVEALNIGDQVLNQAGEAVAVKWIGRRTVNPAFAKIMEQLPVCISAGALGHNTPSRDLYVTPDHAMLVDGCLVHASALINGRTIYQMDTWNGDVEYFHIETENHEIIMAENAPAETFIDNVSREKFDNYAEYATLYPNAAPMVELDLPRVKFARQLSRVISTRLNAIADEISGVAQQTLAA